MDNKTSKEKNLQEYTLEDGKIIHNHRRARTPDAPKRSGLYRKLQEEGAIERQYMERGGPI